MKIEDLKVGMTVVFKDKVDCEDIQCGIRWYDELDGKIGEVTEIDFENKDFSTSNSSGYWMPFAWIDYVITGKEYIDEPIKDIELVPGMVLEAEGAPGFITVLSDLRLYHSENGVVYADLYNKTLQALNEISVFTWKVKGDF